jgi:hypothetical protein
LQAIHQNNSGVDQHFDRQANVKKSLLDLKDLELENASNEKLRTEIRRSLQKNRPENAQFVLEVVNQGNKYVDLE